MKNQEKIPRKNSECHIKKYFAAQSKCKFVKPTNEFLRNVVCILQAW